MTDLPPVPETWEELVAMRSFLDSCPGSYLRHKEDQNFYDLYQKLVPKDVFLKIIREQIEPDSAKLLRNRFPYSNVLQNLPDVAQYVLWNLKGPLKEDQITEKVEHRFFGYQWFDDESAPHRKSVPEIWHTHIFVKGIPQYSE